MFTTVKAICVFVLAIFSAFPALQGCSGARAVPPKSAPTPVAIFSDEAPVERELPFPPGAIEALPDGTVIIADYSAPVLRAIPPSDKISESFAVELDGDRPDARIIEIIADKNGGLFCLLQYNSKENRRKLVYVTPERDLLPCDYFHKTGAELELISACLDSEMNPVVLAFPGPSVYFFARDGFFLGDFGNSDRPGDRFKEPTSIIFQPVANYFLIADQRRHALSAFSAEGDYVRTIGRSGRDRGEFAGKIGFVAADRHGRIFALDMRLDRIVSFLSNGTSASPCPLGCNSEDITGMACDSSRDLLLLSKANVKKLIAIPTLALK